LFVVLHVSGIWIVVLIITSCYELNDYQLPYGSILHVMAIVVVLASFIQISAQCLVWWLMVCMLVGVDIMLIFFIEKLASLIHCCVV